MNVATEDGGVDVATGHISLIAAAERLKNHLVAVGVLVDVEGHGVDVAVLVAAAKDLLEQTGMDFGGGGAIDVGARVVVGCRRVSVVACGAVAVTAAEQLFVAAAVDDEAGVGASGRAAHVGSVAATVDGLNGVFRAVIDMHRGTLGGSRSGVQCRLVGCLVAAAIHCGNGIFLIIVLGCQ